MSDLLGAWSLADPSQDDTLRRQLPPRLRKAMRQQLHSPQQLREQLLPSPDAPQLWICAHNAKALPLDEPLTGALLAYEGILLDPRPDDWQRQAAEAPAIDALPAAQGHYVAAIYAARQGTLRLFRSLSGGERLYLARRGDLLFFASTLRALLAHPDIKARIDRSVLDEALLTGLPVFGSQSLLEGIWELLPGHSLLLEEGEQAERPQRRQRWHSPKALESARGDHRQLAAELRERLIEAVVISAGDARPVPVALSGGIDSSAIAAAAVEAFGADQIRLFTYEFVDPEHSTEVEYARMVAAKLGITDHQTFGFDLEDFRQALPEIVWRSEGAVYWPKAFMLPIARHIHSFGHDRYLTGFGIGSHMAYMEDLSRALQLAPRPSMAVAHWRKARFGFGPWPRRLQKLHPGLEPPHPRLYYMLLRMLRHEGIHDHALAAMYPPRMAPMFERLRDLDDLLPNKDRDLPLAQRLQRMAFAHLISCIDVTRPEKASREVGCYRLSPAHLARTIPYCYFPPMPQPALWSDARKLRPGKYLLRLAFEEMLPDEILYRKKDWGDAVASPVWRRYGRVMMLEALPRFPQNFARFGARYDEAMTDWEPRSILASGLGFRLWERMFLEMPPRNQPPSWEEIHQFAKDQGEPVLPPRELTALQEARP